MSEPVRVLQVVTQMNRAGVECRLMDIYRNTDRSKIQFDFLTFRQSPSFFEEEIKSLGGSIFHLSPLTVRNLPRANRELRSFFMQHKEYKIVHAHLNQWCGVVLKNAKCAGIPVRIAHSRNAFIYKNLQNVVKDVLKLTVNKYATHRFALSKMAGNWLFGKRAVKTGRVLVLPNAIECDKFRYNPVVREKVRSDLGIVNELVLIHVGNFRSQKNHKFIIDVFEALTRVKPDAKLMLIGNDGMNGTIQRYAAEKNVNDRVLFLGLRTDIDELLQAGDVFVFPSLYEGLPGALLEAQAAGLPCVISNTLPEEVMLTDNIVKLPINKGVDIWVKQILAYHLCTRISQHERIRAMGYDVYDLCYKMTELYVKLTKI